MNSPHHVDKDVLLVTARVQAALAIIPRIVGPKKDWVEWMRDGLREDSTSIPYPSVGSPHSRLLGSLRAMLVRHYLTGMTIDTLRFDDVRADDSSITGDSKYVDVPPDMLPELDGGPFWWQALPPSVRLDAENTGTRESPSPPPRKRRKIRTRMIVDSDEAGPSTSSVLGDEGRASVSEAESESKEPKESAKGAVRTSCMNVDSDEESDNEGRPSASEEEAESEGRGRSRMNVDSDEESDGADPSTGSTLEDEDRASVSEEEPQSEASDEREESEEPEQPMICDACKSRGSTCVWPSRAEALHSKACAACVIQDTCCEVVGMFLVPCRQQKWEDTLEHDINEARRKAAELSLEMAALKKERSQMELTQNRLEAQIRELKRKKRRSRR